MNTIILVDDEEPRRAAFSTSLAAGIEKITAGRTATRLLQNVVLREAHPEVRKLARETTRQGHTVIGFLVDLVEKPDIEAGAVLLDKLVADPDLGKIPVVIYTSKYVDVNPADLVARGAKAVLIREPIDSLDDLAREVLREFDVPVSRQRRSAQR